MGEHHDALRDHELQADIIRELLAVRRSKSSGDRVDAPLVAVGLEAVQRKFQRVLDGYLAGTVSERELERQTEWGKRWFWPFERYLPVFRLCKAEGLPLLALNVDSEELSIVESKGYRGLSKDQLTRYVPDGKAFAAFAQTIAFKEYANYVVTPSYQAHQRMGILRTTISGEKLDEDMTLSNFISGRLLWDESMASTSAKYAIDHPETLVVGLVGSDHVKFGCGVPARCARTIAASASPTITYPLDTVRTVMLNPGPVDTARDPNAPTSPVDDTGGGGTSTLTLQLRYAAIPGDGRRSVPGGDAAIDIPAAIVNGQARGPVLAVADLLWYSPGALT